MKNIRLFLIIAALLVLSAHSQKATANRAAGGELIYEWIGDSTYRFLFRYYNDCAGDTADTAQTLCLYNPCLNSGYTKVMDRWLMILPGAGQDGGGPVTQGCSGVKTTCDSPGSLFQGYKEYWYSVITTLPAKCSLWKFSVTVTARNNNLNLNPATNKNNLYIEAAFNNSSINQNSSPYFTIKPIPYVCNGQPIAYNNGAIDPDGDSLVTEIIQPMTKTPNCLDTAEIIPFAAATPAYSIPTNPFQTNNSVTVNTRTGQISFTPAEVGPNAISVRVKEYRNGVLIGYITRDARLQVIPCVYDTPKVTIEASSVNGGYSNDSIIYGCVEQPLSFCWDVKADSAATIFVVGDNHNLIPRLQTANVSYIHNKTDSVRGCFTWTPAATEIGLYGFILTIKDSTCRPPGIVNYYTRAISLNIWGPVSVGNDTAICLGKMVKLKAKGGGDYNWTVLSGSGGSIACPSCDSTLVKPSLKTTYRVLSTASAFCGNNADTVTVSVFPSIPSSVFIIASDTNITESDRVIVSSLGVNCPHPTYQWEINGVAIPNMDTNKLVFDSFKDLDTLTCRLLCADTCASPADTTSNSIVFHVTPLPVSVDGTPKLLADIRLYPNPNNGNFTLNGNIQEAVKISVFNMLGQEVYKMDVPRSSTGLNKTISIQGQVNGIYMLQLKSEKGMRSFKINVNR